jgi:hypothetical protein
MRKAPAVLVLMIASLLLLQAPASAQHLYRLKRTDGARGGLPSTWTAYIDCAPGSTAKIKSGKFQATITTTVKASSNPDYKGRVEFDALMKPAYASSTTATTTVTCTLPRTGGYILQQLVVGIGLLMLGGLFMMLTMHPSILVRVRRPNSTPPD